MIKKIETVHYPQGLGDYTTKSIDGPDWDTIISLFKSMHPYEIPTLILLKHIDRPDVDLMMVTGGNDIFHIQLADHDGNWLQAFNPYGSDEMIDVWTSDQGFSCEHKFTWPMKTTSEIIKYYFVTGERHPDFWWK